MRIQKEAQAALAEGLASIIQQYQLPLDFPIDVQQAAMASMLPSRTEFSNGRRDATNIPFVTLDPATSTDLDQAFYLERDGHAIVLHYALADVGAFVQREQAIETEAWKRGITIYGISGKIPVYPKTISQQAASLLPDGPRPAILVVVSIAPDGSLKLRCVESIVCSSRAKLAYDSVDLSTMPLLTEFANRMWANETARGAVRVDFPQQEVVMNEAAPGGVQLELKSRIESEEMNSALSLAVNMALGGLLCEAKVGLFRVMDVPDSKSIEQLRRSASAIGITWMATESLYDVQKRLDVHNSVHQRFLLEARRSSGRVSYEVYSPDKKPWHAAIAATYVHATAPMRRLGDRYVLDLALLVAKPVPPSILATIAKLPDIMRKSESRANSVDRAVVDLMEAVSLQDRIGEVLEAVVVDVDNGTVQSTDFAIQARVHLSPNAANGDKIQVRIDEANPTQRRIKLSPIRSV
jgi:exoribonuclease R